MGTDEPKQKIVSVAHILESAEVRVGRHLGGKLSELCGQLVGPLPFASLACPGPSGHQLLVRWIGFPLGAPGVRWYERLRDILVQSVKVEIREDGADNAPLRATAQGAIVLPILQVPRLEKVLDEPQEAVVVDLLPQD